MYYTQTHYITILLNLTCMYRKRKSDKTTYVSITVTKSIYCALNYFLGKRISIVSITFTL